MRLPNVSPLTGACIAAWIVLAAAVRHIFDDYLFRAKFPHSCPDVFPHGFEDFFGVAMRKFIHYVIGKFFQGRGKV